jgi:hypothetical protein
MNERTGVEAEDGFHGACGSDDELDFLVAFVEVEDVCDSTSQIAWGLLPGGRTQLNRYIFDLRFPRIERVPVFHEKERGRPMHE